jgi:hypothetical protein
MQNSILKTLKIQRILYEKTIFLLKLDFIFQVFKKIYLLRVFSFNRELIFSFEFNTKDQLNLNDELKKRTLE